MKISTFRRIIANHNKGLDTHMGRYLYNIQYDFMAGCHRIIRCLKGWEGGTAVQYDFCGNVIGSTQGNNWEWRERIPEEAWK